MSFEDAAGRCIGGVTVTARLAAPASADVAGTTQGLANVENIIGSPGDDVLIGDSTAQRPHRRRGQRHRLLRRPRRRSRRHRDADGDAGGEPGTTEADTYASIENLTGGEGDDTLIADADRTSSTAARAARTPRPTRGAPTDVTASLAAGTGATEADVFVRIDNLTGGLGSDILSGNDADNVLDGGASGSDTVSYADRAVGEDIVASLVALTGGDPDSRSPTRSSRSTTSSAARARTR